MLSPIYILSGAQVYTKMPNKEHLQKNTEKRFKLTLNKVLDYVLEGPIVNFPTKGTKIHINIYIRYKGRPITATLGT